MVYGYIRVSTDRQTVENQRFELTRFAKSQGMKIDKWVEESISGTVPWKKRALGSLIHHMRPDDILLCSELSRLGRTIFMILEVLNHCLKAGVRVWSIKDGFRLGDDLSSKVLAFAFALSAEVERNLISQRTREALARRRAIGVQLGRPQGKNVRSKLDFYASEIQSLLNKGCSHKQIAKVFQVHPQTVSRFLKIHQV